jgi:hypothetical protein
MDNYFINIRTLNLYDLIPILIIVSRSFKFEMVKVFPIRKGPKLKLCENGFSFGMHYQLHSVRYLIFVFSPKYYLIVFINIYLFFRLSSLTRLYLF